MAKSNRRWWSAIALITLAGLALRLYSLLTESIFLDEVSLHWLVSDRSFSSMLDEVKATENSPVLGFSLAWAAAKIGSSPDWIRLPAMVAGVITIPLTALLGLRSVSRRAGLMAAGFAAASPLLVFFSVEARPYALGCMFTTLTALLLLDLTSTSSQNRSRNIVGALWPIAAAAAMLSHYTAIFAIAAAALWVLITHPTARLRVLLGSVGAAVIFSAVWLGPFLTQYSHSDVQVKFTKFIAPLTPKTLWEMSATLVSGRPIVGLARVPGFPLGVVIAACLVVAVGAVALRIASLQAGERLRICAKTLKSPVGMLVVIVIAAPVGLIVSGILADGSFLLARNEIYALPPLLVLIAGALGLLSKRLAYGTGIALCAALAGASLIGIADWQRPDSHSAASAIAARWQPGDIVIEQTFSPNTANDGDINSYLNGSIASSFRFARMSKRKDAEVTIADGFAEALLNGSSVFVTAADTVPQPRPAGPPANLANRFRLVWQRQLTGTGRLTVSEWQPVR